MYLFLCRNHVGRRRRFLQRIVAVIERDGGSLGISIAGGSGSVPLKPDDKVHVLTATNMYIHFYSLRFSLIVFVHFATENSFLFPLLLS